MDLIRNIIPCLMICIGFLYSSVKLCPMAPTCSYIDRMVVVDVLKYVWKFVLIEKKKYHT